MKQIFLFITLGLLANSAYSAQKALQTQAETKAAYSLRSEQLEKLLYNQLTSLPRELIKIIVEYEKLSGKIEHKLTGPTQAVRCLVVQDATHELISGDDAGQIMVWDLQTGTQKGTIAAHSGALRSLIILSRHKIASSGWDASIKIWRLTRWDCLTTMRTASPLCVITCGEQKKLLYENPAGTLCCYDDEAKTTRYIKKSLQDSDRIRHSIALSNNKIAVTTQANNCIEIWDCSNNKQIQSLAHENSNILTFVFIPPNQIASSHFSDKEKMITLWDIASGKPLQTLSGLSSYVNCLTMLADGSLVFGSDDGTVRIWEYQNKKAPVCTIFTIPKQPSDLTKSVSPPLSQPSSSQMSLTIQEVNPTVPATALCLLPNGFLAVGDAQGDITLIS